MQEYTKNIQIKTLHLLVKNLKNEIFYKEEKKKPWLLMSDCLPLAKLI